LSILGITCLRDDGVYAAEWIAHHFAAGFDRMLIFSHDNADGTDELLNALSADPRICYVSFAPSGKKSVQWQALKLAQDHPWILETTWALFFDCDEFLCLPEGGTIKDFIADLETKQGKFDALALPWRLYGTGGQTRRTDGLTPERFTQAAPMDLHFPLAHLFKTLHRPSAFRALGVHRPRTKKSKPARWLGPDGSPLSDAFAQSDNAISLYGTGRAPRRIWLNHYSLRSTEEFIAKRTRGLPNHMDRELGLTYWAERNWNTEDAPEILPMLAASKAELARLPDVRALSDACKNFHAKAYASAMENLETLRLVFRLGLLTGATPPTQEEGQAFLKAQIDILRKART